MFGITARTKGVLTFLVYWIFLCGGVGGGWQGRIRNGNS